MFNYTYYFHGNWSDISTQSLETDTSFEDPALLICAVRAQRTHAQWLVQTWRQMTGDNFFAIITEATWAWHSRNFRTKTDRPRHRIINSDEVQRVILSQLEFRCFCSHSHYGSLDNWINALDEAPDIRPEIGLRRRWGVAYGRFHRISASLDADFDRCFETISTNAQEWIDVGGRWTVDENVSACLCQGPTVSIPRKPHPTGLRSYLLCVELEFSHRTFFVQAHHDFDTKKLTVRQILDSVFQLASQHTQPTTCTMDAFFGVKELLEQPPTTRAKWIASWNKGRFKGFWSLLFDKLEKGQYRQVIHKSGKFIASAFRDNGDMALISNALHVAGTANQHTPAMTPSPEIPAPIESPVETAEQPGRLFCQFCHGTGNFSEAFECDSCGKWTHNRCPKAHPYRRHNFCRTTCRKTFQDLLRSELCDDPPPPSEGLVNDSESESSSSSSTTLLFSHRARSAFSRLPLFALQELFQNYDLLDDSQVATSTKEELLESLLGPDDIQPQTDELSSSSGESSSSTSSQISLTESQTDGNSLEFDPEALWVKIRKMSPVSLRNRLEQHGVKPKGLKEERQLQLFLAEIPVSLRNSYLEEKRASITPTPPSVPSGTRPDAQEFYLQTFSAVDTFDKRFYELYRYFNASHWQQAGIFTMMIMVIVNMHAISDEVRALSQTGADTSHHYRQIPTSENIRSFALELLNALKDDICK